MAQVNKYADRAAYTADAKRLSTKSAVSFIENETTTIYDGVNTVVGKSAAAIGDLAVFDKTDGVIKYIIHQKRNDCQGADSSKPCTAGRRLCATR